MPVWIAWLIGGLAASAGSLVGRVLLALGIGFVAYQGISTLMDWMLAQVQAEMGTWSVFAKQLAGVLKIDVCIKMIFSAIATRLSLDGLQAAAGGTIKRMRVQ